MEFREVDSEKLIYMIKHGNKRKGIKVQIVEGELFPCLSCVLKRICKKQSQPSCRFLPIAKMINTNTLPKNYTLRIIR